MKDSERNLLEGRKKGVHSTQLWLCVEYGLGKFRPNWDLAPPVATNDRLRGNLRLTGIHLVFLQAEPSPLHARCCMYASRTR
jgi:hypothetical protein